MTQTNGTDGETPYRCVMFSAMDTASVIVRGYEMPFGGQTRMDSRSHALDGGAHIGATWQIRWIDPCAALTGELCKNG